MDPDQALSRLLELSERIINGSPKDLDWPSLVVQAEELAETFVGLDEWLRRGGFLPKAWSRGRAAPPHAEGGTP